MTYAGVKKNNILCHLFSNGSRKIYVSIYHLSMRETEKAVVNVHILTIEMGSRWRLCVVFLYLFQMPEIIAKLKICPGMMVHICNLSTQEAWTRVS